MDRTDLIAALRALPVVERMRIAFDAIEGDGCRASVALHCESRALAAELAPGALGEYGAHSTDGPFSAWSDDARNVSILGPREPRAKEVA